MHPAEAMWQTKPEVPLAFKHPENIITPQSVDQWLKDLQNFVKIYPNASAMKEFMTNEILDINKLRKKYETELRFLSREDSMKGLKEFAEEITGTFSPEDTLFYFPPESSSAGLLYHTLLSLQPQLANYGTTRDSRRELKLGKPNDFKKHNVSDAGAFVYVDDWVLSANHLDDFLTKDVAGRFHTFHLAVSDAGAKFLKAESEHIKPRYKFRVKSKNPANMYSEVPIFGSHKIPDRIPEYYAPRHEGLYSIFGKQDGQFILREDRLIDHSGTL